MQIVSRKGLMPGYKTCSGCTWIPPTAIIKIIVPEIETKIRIKCDVFCQSAGVTIQVYTMQFP